MLEICEDGAPKLAATHSQAPAPMLRRELLALTQDNGCLAPRRFGGLDQRVGQWFADAAVALLQIAGATPASVRAVGSHGQTVYHAAGANPPFTLQIGDPNRIAAVTGIPTVADFRRADMAVGGQGAPLVPAFHHAVFSHRDRPRCIVNIGGIANVTLLPATSRTRDVFGFDTGPGNALLDAWAEAHLGTPQDSNGRWAASGQVDPELLAEWMRDPYFAQAPPKSTGREAFHLDWLSQCSPDLPHRNPACVQRTLVELSARTIANAILTHGADAQEVFLCGGGAHNPLLRGRLTALLSPRAVSDTSVCGIAPDWVEAAAFAWLAMRTMRGLPGNLPAVTGARKAVVLGGIYCPFGERDS